MKIIESLKQRRSVYGIGKTLPVDFFYDADVVKSLQERYAAYAANFPIWAQQANGMLQLAIWTGLRELGIGANIQHYNPVIDGAVRALFGLPESHVLVAQMPFGGIVAEPQAKAVEEISLRVRVVR
ncbi:MAG: nitroreductase family protein [Kiritimatiellae bacterium]|nr:nitroreductase family protein [Kiritimatiellia bacterium]